MADLSDLEPGVKIGYHPVGADDVRQVGIVRRHYGGNVNVGVEVAIFLSERIPAFSPGVNRVRPVTQPPSVAGLEPKRLGHTVSNVVSRVPPHPTRLAAGGCGPHSTHVCGAPQARLMAFGRQGVTGAGTEPRGSTAWERAASRNRVAMTRLRMGAHVAVPQDAPGRGTKPAPPTPGETVLKPNRAGRVPRCGREAPPFTAGEDVTPDDPGIEERVPYDRIEAIE